MPRIINGTPKGERIDGSGRSEEIYGKGGNDKLIGHPGDDYIDGGSGNDTIYGGQDHDTLVGGGGRDTFVFNSLLAKDSDTILDFTHGKDRIGLDSQVFSELSRGHLSSAAFFAGTIAHDSSDRLIYDESSGNLFYDADGTGRVKQFLLANLADHPVLSASDFTIL